ncbi:MAG: D-alanyl-D-alanine carboxypeptidase/D-alanyl-D-alanine-endopeptidase [Sediminibacterium sp. Gen4]|jgi:serine-type D-Ala-D-Ala carboxypeptidase/endopeptidase (penicillin-binding protein 4)|uniref:D-alanyl-D-alanine carboxypeptidase/D-alanyl-D-alanine endopeptidase n=1 Tax=unclassified Sediminibacterium TaxID=2635961 RepID=UPI0015B81342|nr:MULTISPECIES: D-alanyl-D-alanine carboxypeptidase/D-alanyl-D-alanine-endopeptidase [unclassified Sediminibacterium]MBW0160992.1 D-alanyl-D-alanine carboxypeptidase/D-alanyl-D-alanine-endopeptidase [Sediminibacterium sp.]MBW0164476.1 D-alanyl-D-alanine carboxypeptidase/D-alanyl-D-alanine-endopeptidase [Sediminibacterium sp.]NWK67461.1 D-alanyl-D-alanine carboxypeptidase/D-alanyl-D-alanine-endopeptidase [Sediminibacterium sp. Gen4]
MRRLVYVSICLFGFIHSVVSQSVQERLDKAFQQFMTDPQMRYAIAGISVVNSESGQTLFEYNGNIGLAPASCQKLVTSATALELLGINYRYKTEIGYDGEIKDGKLMGNLHIKGYGDPTLGSWRYTGTSDTSIIKQWQKKIQDLRIKKIEGQIMVYADQWETASVPGGWPWDDMGNYYGAGAYGLNWRENQYDLVLKSGPNPGDKVMIVKMIPVLHNMIFTNELVAGKKGSGDNAYIYSAPYNDRAFIRGTIPPAQSAFTISGSMTHPGMQLGYTLAAALTDGTGKQPGVREQSTKKSIQPIHVHYSPVLDSINYWFMRKSVNLYGETLVKTLAFEKNRKGATEDGLEIMKDFWKTKGIDPASLRMIDGSGLSPQNRVTANSLVKVLQYARSRSWFTQYMAAFPEYNKMKLKSGTIGGSKGFAGYHTSKEGITYTVAFIVNNYNGSANEIVRKMFLVLDELK